MKSPLSGIVLYSLIDFFFFFLVLNYVEICTVGSVIKKKNRVMEGLGTYKSVSCAHSLFP